MLQMMRQIEMLTSLGKLMLDLKLLNSRKMISVVCSNRIITMSVMHFEVVFIHSLCAYFSNFIFFSSSFTLSCIYERLFFSAKTCTSGLCFSNIFNKGLLN
jgi:hypothetical protein